MSIPPSWARHLKKGLTQFLSQEVVKTAAGSGLDQHIAAGEGEGVGVLVCEPLVRCRRLDRHLLEYFRLAASADLGISPARNELIGQHDTMDLIERKGLSIQRGVYGRARVRRTIT